MNEENFKFLTSIYQNAKTALQSIKDISPMIEDKNLEKETSNQYAEYDIIVNECEMIAGETSKQLKDNNFIEKAKLWTSIKLTTLTNKDTRHLEEMLALGTFMGIIQCYKDLSENIDANTELKMLSKKLLSMEEKFFENYKNMLAKI